MEDETLIEVKNLVKQYGNHAAVDNLSFTVETGKVVGFLGPNGAGKSTTMNMITGYIAPTSGNVLIDGVDMEEEPEQVRKNIFRRIRRYIRICVSVSTYILWLS